MADIKPEDKKPVAKAIVDVAEPGKTAPANNSKSVLVTNRPIVKDPMVKQSAEDASADTTESDKKTGPVKSHNVIQPLESSPTPEAPKTETTPESSEDPKSEESSEPTETAASSSTEPMAGAKAEVAMDKVAEKAAAEQAKHDASIEKLIESKKYFLPINAVEQRRSKRNVVLGLVLSVILTVAWVNVALDAGLVEINGIKPVTHFFSN
jgi:hypothetical protein